MNHTPQMQLQMKIPNTHSLLLQSVCWALLASLRNTKFKKTKIQKYKIKKTQKYKNENSLSLQSVACALLASLPLCLSESAAGLSHVVKVTKHRNKYKYKYNDKHEYKYKIQLQVGRNGRQVVHQSINSKGNSGKSLGRKVISRIFVICPGRSTLTNPPLFFSPSAAPKFCKSPTPDNATQVRRRGRNTLGQPAAALRQAPAAPVPLVPQVFCLFAQWTQKLIAFP